MIKLLKILRSSHFGLFLRNRLSTYPAYVQHNYDQGIYLFRTKLKLRVFLSLLSETLRMPRQVKVKVNKTKKLRNLFKGENVVLMAYGPSIRSFLPFVSQFRDCGWRVACVNLVNKTGLVDDLQPDFWFITDATLWNPEDQSESKDVDSLKRFLSSRTTPVQVFQPANQVDFVDYPNLTSYLDHRNISGLVAFSSPIKPWGLLPSVVLQAVSTLDFLGFKKIYLVGVDGSAHRHYSVNDLNEVFFDPNGFAAYVKRPGVTDSQKNLLKLSDTHNVRNLSDILFSQVLFYSQLKRIARGKTFCVTGTPFLDALPKYSPEEMLSQS